VNEFENPSENERLAMASMGVIESVLNKGGFLIKKINNITKEHNLRIYAWAKENFKTVHIMRTNPFSLNHESYILCLNYSPKTPFKTLHTNHYFSTQTIETHDEIRKILAEWRLALCAFIHEPSASTNINHCLPILDNLGLSPILPFSKPNIFAKRATSYPFNGRFELFNKPEGAPNRYGISVVTKDGNELPYGGEYDLVDEVLTLNKSRLYITHAPPIEYSPDPLIDYIRDAILTNRSTKEIILQLNHAFSHVSNPVHAGMHHMWETVNVVPHLPPFNQEILIFKVIYSENKTFVINNQTSIYLISKFLALLHHINLPLTKDEIERKYEILFGSLPTDNIIYPLTYPTLWEVIKANCQIIDNKYILSTELLQQVQNTPRKTMAELIKLRCAISIRNIRKPHLSESIARARSFSVASKTQRTPGDSIVWRGRSQERMHFDVDQPWREVKSKVVDHVVKEKEEPKPINIIPSVQKRNVTPSPTNIPPNTSVYKPLPTTRATTPTTDTTKVPRFFKPRVQANGAQVQVARAVNNASLYRILNDTKPFWSDARAILKEKNLSLKFCSGDVFEHHIPNLRYTITGVETFQNTIVASFPHDDYEPDHTYLGITPMYTKDFYYYHVNCPEKMYELETILYEHFKVVSPCNSINIPIFANQLPNAYYHGFIIKKGDVMEGTELAFYPICDFPCDGEEYTVWRSISREYLKFINPTVKLGNHMRRYEGTIFLVNLAASHEYEAEQGEIVAKFQTNEKVLKHIPYFCKITNHNTTTNIVNFSVNINNQADIDEYIKSTTAICRLVNIKL
jgi:hypothetical protein